ncbi:MAG: hypothetical protein AABX02_03770 [archaeon]
METHIQFPAHDGKTIYGVVNTKGKKPKTVLLVIHGRPGAAHESPGLNAARFFPSKGIAVCRISLYGSKPNARRFMECTTKQHGKDIDATVRFLRTQYDHVFVAGHSWGGPSIWFSDTSKMDGIVLWDPSCDLRKCNKGYSFVSSLKAYMIQWNWPDLISKKLYDECEKYPLDKLIPFVKKITVPTKFILAEKGMWIPDGKKLYNILSGPKSLKILKGAGHLFSEEKAESELFRETLSWIRKCS